MVAAYVEAGCEKLHLDTSMGCDGEASALPDELVAARAARLAVAAEAAAERMNTAPRYVIGTEVPVPGGAPGAVGRPEVTRPAAVRATYEAHRGAFEAAGAGRAFARVVALVVQPGVEFGNERVAAYEPAWARALSATLDELPGIVFEAHSTDYQPAPALAALVRDGFAILKVGPALTFALREALYGLDHVAAALDAAWNGNSLRDAMESVMLANPDNWRAHYHGTPEQERWLRHYGYSDRIRYYWPAPAARTAVNGLLDRLRGTVIPEALVSQYLSPLYPEVAAGALVPVADALLLASVRRILAIYATACRD
jgi:D-tagatose-1,6-bisphosphate aldolase subunit GatZ/KbaZ